MCLLKFKVDKCRNFVCLSSSVYAREDHNEASRGEFPPVQSLICLEVWFYRSVRTRSILQSQTLEWSSFNLCYEATIFVTFPWGKFFSRSEHSTLASLVHYLLAFLWTDLCWNPVGFLVSMELEREKMTRWLRCLLASGKERIVWDLHLHDR